MCPWDLSWQTNRRIWSVVRFVSKLTVWTWAVWWSRSELEDLKWDATPHPSLELWSTGCKTRFPCWIKVHILWHLSLTELSLLVPLPELAGDHLGGQHPHEPGSARPKLYLIPLFYSLQDPTWYIWQKFKSKSNYFYCHITTAQVPWWVKFLRACSRLQKKIFLHIDSTYTYKLYRRQCAKKHIHILSTHRVL